MKISVFTSMTNPEKRNDPWIEAIKCYEDLGDELIIVGEDWPYDFKWDYIGKTFQKGFDQCSGDWVIRMDLDYFFKKSDMKKIRDFLSENNDAPAVAFPQYQIFTSDRYQLKTKLCLAVNKAKFPEIKLNGGGDLCQPTLNGKQLLHKNVPNLNVPIYQYDSFFRTKEIISEDRARFARAWFSFFNSWDDRGGPTPEKAFEAWFDMIKKRYSFHVLKLKINDHPVFIRERLDSIEKNQFGFDAFGLKQEIKRKPKHYFTGYKQKYF
tara:strand:- start:1294 stop:2091 length:798 start_codon:yes stop_codon:yes gene_type:complete